MLVSEIIRKTKRIFGEGQATGGIFITDADIIDWINDGMLQIIRETKCNVTSTSGQLANNFPVTVPQGVQITRVTYNNQALNYTDPDDLDSKYLDLTIKDVPVFWYPTYSAAGVLMVNFFPPATTADATPCAVLYSSLATNVTVVGDTPGIPIVYHEDLVVWCKMRAYERDQNYRAMQSAQEEFNGRIATRIEDSNMASDGYSVIRDDPWEW